MSAFESAQSPVATLVAAGGGEIANNVQHPNEGHEPQTNLRIKVAPEPESKPNEGAQVPTPWVVATPEVILGLIREARQARSAFVRSDAGWTDRMIAIAMMWRGVAPTAVIEEFEISASDLAIWLENCIQEGRCLDLEMHVILWAAMLDQKDPELKATAERVVCADCLGRLATFFPWANESVARAHEILTLIVNLLSDPVYRASFFEPCSSNVAIERPPPKALRQFVRALERVRNSRGAHRSSRKSPTGGQSN